MVRHIAAAQRELSVLLRAMKAVLHDGVFVFASLPRGIDVREVAAVATIREPEGWTVVAEESEALRAGLVVRFRAAWLTLSVHSDLHAVGFTGAFASALADAGIACNVIAGAYHDHVFVPVEQAQLALARLQELQHSGQQR